MYHNSPLWWCGDALCAFPNLTLASLWKVPPVRLELHEAFLGKCHLKVRQTVLARAFFFQTLGMKNNFNTDFIKRICTELD